MLLQILHLYLHTINAVLKFCFVFLVIFKYRYNLHTIKSTLKSVITSHNQGRYRTVGKNPFVALSGHPSSSSSPLELLTDLFGLYIVLPLKACHINIHQSFFFN